MTKVSYFFVFYILVVQPALIGRLRNDVRLYQLAGFNAGIFFITLVIVSIFNFPKPKSKNVEKEITCNDNESLKEPKKSEEKNGEEKSEDVENKTNETDGEISPENTSEKVEDVEVIEEEKGTQKSECRESVCIPKIVQPLTGHSSKKKKKNIKFGQWIVLLITLALAALMTRVLREFFGNRSVAISLFIGWILYLLIGKIVDIDGFYKAKVLFTNRLYVVLILGGIGYGAYIMQQNEQSLSGLLPTDLGSKIVESVKNRFEIEENTDVDGSGMVYVFEGTGEIISIYSGMDAVDWENNSGNVENDNSTANDEQSAGNTNSGSSIEEETVETVKTTPDDDKQITMGEAIKYLLTDSELSTSRKVTFSYVSSNSELYPYFKTAYDKKMIGKNTDPSKIISCETYITMKGILEGRNVGAYSDIKSAYREKAKSLGELNGCEKGKYVTTGNL